MQPWIYLSPHLDDVALSCGGLVWQQTQAGAAVEIWTLCAGDPPEAPLSPFAQSLHDRWKTGQAAYDRRRAEDIESCRHLGANVRHFPLTDCIYRRHPQTGQALYDSEESLWFPLDPSEAGLVRRLRAELAQALPEPAVVICPLALGGHVDHRLTRAAAEGLPRRLLYYADYPYALQEQATLQALQEAGWQPRAYPITSAALEAWQASIAAHGSQISTFWDGLPAMQAAIADYAESMQGVTLWQPPDD